MVGDETAEDAKNHHDRFPLLQTANRRVASP